MRREPLDLAATAERIHDVLSTDGGNLIHEGIRMLAATDDCIVSEVRGEQLIAM